jgi:hypothetical protein
MKGREPSRRVENVVRGEKSPESEGIHEPIYTLMFRARKPRR